MTDQILGPGVYYNLDETAYHRDPTGTLAMSQSCAKTLIEASPWHAWNQHPRGGNNGRTMSRDMTAGAIVEALILGGSNVRICRIDAPDFRTKDARVARDAAIERGELPIIGDEFDTLQEQARVIRESIADLIGSASLPQVSAIWDSDGVRCKGRFDLLAEDEGAVRIVDLKRTGDLSDYRGRLGRHCVDMGYDIQAAAYIEAIETLKPEAAGRVQFCNLWIDPAGALKLTEPSGEMLELGRRRWSRAVATWGRCLAEQSWPGFRSQGDRLFPPKFALDDEMIAGMAVSTPSF